MSLCTSSVLEGLANLLVQPLPRVLLEEKGILHQILKSNWSAIHLRFRMCSNLSDSHCPRSCGELVLNNSFHNGKTVTVILWPKSCRRTSELSAPVHGQRTFEMIEKWIQQTHLSLSHVAAASRWWTLTTLKLNCQKSLQFARIMIDNALTYNWLLKARLKRCKPLRAPFKLARASVDTVTYLRLINATRRVMMLLKIYCCCLLVNVTKTCCRSPTDCRAFKKGLHSYSC